MMNLNNLLFNNEAVDGIESPLDYFYIKIVRFSMKCVNSWPSKQIGEEESQLGSLLMSIFLLVLTCINFFGGILYICLKGNNLTFLEIGYAYITTFMNFVILSRLLTLTFSTKYREVAKEFLTRIHLFYFKDASEYAMETHKQVHFISHVFTLCLAIQTLAGVILFNAIPMYNYFSSGNYKNSGVKNLTFETSVYILYPFDTYSSTNGYICICIFNCIFSFLAAIWFCMFDLLLSLMVFHLWGHFKILLHKLNTFPKPTVRHYEMILSCEKYSEKELQKVTELLKECIDYHRTIVHFTKEMSQAFGAMLFAYYTFHQVSGCLLLLECSQLTTRALIRYLPTTVILYQQLIQLSIIFELIGSTSEKLKHAVYGLPWEMMDVKNRKIVVIFLMNVQEPIHVKALGVANVGVTSMATILKTSLSYFTFLRSM